MRVRVKAGTDLGCDKPSGSRRHYGHGLSCYFMPPGRVPTHGEPGDQHHILQLSQSLSNIGKSLPRAGLLSPSTSSRVFVPSLHHTGLFWSQLQSIALNCSHRELADHQTGYSEMQLASAFMGSRVSTLNGHRGLWMVISQLHFFLPISVSIRVALW
jgi:hypothetical protein